ncbi:MAG: DUF4349 domain-containing protein [Anaerolineales bacterium]|nr:DUF4349 domain-containing protein [Anaerolineales bacterium]
MVRKLFFIWILSALALAACAPQMVTPQVLASTVREAYATAVAPVEKQLDAFSGAAESRPEAADDRLVIKNANLTLIVKDTQESLQAITAMVTGLGGFVVSSNTYQTRTGTQGNKVLQGTISFRVPAERFDEALAQLRRMAVEVDSESITGEDVTAQYTDLESQLRNLEAAEAQLQEIMREAKDTEDVLNVFNQLTSIRGQIEQVKGQMKYFRESAAMSLINVSLIPDALSQPIEVAGWRPEGVARDALQALVYALQGLATAAIWLVIYFLPLALLILGPLFLLGRWALRRLQRPKTAAGGKAPAA